MNMPEIPCRRCNYGGLRGGRVRYIVVHYTGAPGDTARGNGAYFGREDTGKTSAHFFVDENEVIRSVPENYVAYHCGGEAYYHPECRNGNSLGVEICTKAVNGGYGFSPRAVERALTLIRSLMEKYDIPAERVLRHWDVTHKVCPAPFVGEGKAAWAEFRKRLEEHMTQTEFAQAMERYLQTLAAQPPGGWSQQARDWAEQQGLIRGDGQYMAYRRPVTREELVEILYRLEGDRP